MGRPDFRRQLDILIDRNLAIQWGSRGTAAMIVAQAPVIGYFIGVAWKGQEAAPQTYFVMAVAALWMGCMNACTAVVQERAVYERERMFELDIRAYLLSKIAVLAVIAAAQTLLLLAVQGHFMRLAGGLLPPALGFLTLAAANLSAAGLGLLVSCFARTPYGAVVTVPLLLIPQVLFSRIILQQNVESGVPAAIEKLTITKWAYEALTDLHDGASWGVQLKCLLALLAGLVAFLSASYLKLRSDDN
ncbi:MAG: ABC transporter permease [Elusimicrobia bacterium]|nr:ABC transporter permease [Elusimicrobiota bacterium]